MNDGYLESSGMDCDGWHVEFYDGKKHVHMIFDSMEEAESFIASRFPDECASSGVTYTGYGANTHAPSGN